MLDGLGIEFALGRPAARARQDGVGIVAEGRSLAQGLYERRADERRELRKEPEWFSVQDVVWEPWEREAALAR